MDVALQAVTILIREGEDRDVACGRVAERIQREWKRQNVPEAEISTKQYARLRRAIGDAYRRRVNS
jgi:hypothetical protein